MTRQFNESVNAFVWSCWAELGVSSWSRRHSSWGIEVEPLIALTAFVAPADGRLLRESVDWCATNQDWLSMRQLRHVVSAHRLPFEGEVGRFGATVGGRSNRAWPAAKSHEPYDVPISERSRLRDLSEPSLLQLRMRAMFGVTARAEILRVLLLDQMLEMTAARVANRVAYTRRQVEKELETLVQGGLVSRSDRTGIAAYSLTEPDALQRLVGDLPADVPNWGALTSLLVGLLRLFEALDRRRLSQPAVEVTRRLRALRAEFEALRLKAPSPEHVDEFSAQLAARLSEGDPGALPGARREPRF